MTPDNMQTALENEGDYSASEMFAALRATITRLTAELDEMHMRATVAEGMQRLNAAERDRMGTALSQLIAYAETSDNAQYFTLSAALVEEIARAALQEPK